MSSNLEYFLKLRNHALTRDVLLRFSRGADISWFDETIVLVGRRWYRLAHQHLRAARKVSDFHREWRTTISRSYYATYGASKCVRYLVDGSVTLDGDDHKKVGDLPQDFPERAKWSTFAVELRATGIWPTMIPCMRSKRSSRTPQQKHWRIRPNSSRPAGRT